MEGVGEAGLFTVFAVSVLMLGPGEGPGRAFEAALPADRAG